MERLLEEALSQSEARRLEAEVRNETNFALQEQISALEEHSCADIGAGDEFNGGRAGREVKNKASL